MIMQLLTHPLAMLFLIVALGMALGNIKVANISLGASGVLFVALLFGHFGILVPEAVQQLGIILFVYAIGLQAGPRFFNQFRARGVAYAKIGVVVIVSGALITWLVSRLFSIDAPLALGMYAGAMTSTPGLAAAMDAAGDPTVSVGYGIAYPFGVIGAVLFVQLLPRLLSANLDQEAKTVESHHARGKQVARMHFRVTNPACVGNSLLGLRLHRFTEVNITRIRRGEQIMPARPDTELQRDDVLLAVGKREDLEKLEIIFGERAPEENLLETGAVIARDVFVSSEAITGRSLAELGIFENYGVVITRAWREGMEFVPTGSFIPEVGDSVRVTGGKEDCERFLEVAGQQEKRVHETSILALSLGIFAGVMLGFKEFELPGGATFRLGLAGGPLLVSLVLAHFGRIGKLNIRTPRGAKYLLSQLGLVLFLAGAGTSAGGSFAGVVVRSGVSLLAAGAVITLGAALTGFVVSRLLLGLDMFSVLGAVSGGMTSTPALGAITEISDSDLPLFSYTAVYPVALILITVISQFLIYLL